MLDVLTTLLEVVGLLCLAVAAAVGLWVVAPWLGLVAAGVVLIGSSFVLSRLGGVE